MHASITHSSTPSSTASQCRGSLQLAGRRHRRRQRPRRRRRRHLLGLGTRPGRRSASPLEGRRCPACRRLSAASGSSPACSAASSSASPAPPSTPRPSPPSSRRSSAPSGAFLTIVAGLVQGLGAELVFAALPLRHWTAARRDPRRCGCGTRHGRERPAALVPRVPRTEFVVDLHDLGRRRPAPSSPALLSWLAVRGLAATGALSRFAVGPRDPRSTA